jgi:hypothetical protein
MQGWMRVLLGSKQKKVLQGVIAVLGDSSTSLRSKENAAWILRRVTELSDTAKTQFAGQRSPCAATECFIAEHVFLGLQSGLNSMGAVCRSAGKSCCSCQNARGRLSPYGQDPIFVFAND